MKPSGSIHQILVQKLSLPIHQAHRPAIINCVRTHHPFLTNSIPRSKADLHVSPSISSLPFSIDQGLPPFLSSIALKSLAVDWHDGLLDRLNQHVKGTAVENKSLFDTIIDLAKDRTQVIPFNLASEALNNSFFLNGLKKADPLTHSNRPADNSLLSTAIDETYGSMTQFISYFSNAAMGMSSSGYVWLVCDQDGNLGICATYGAGTILVQTREQRGDWPRIIRSSQIGLDSSGRPLPRSEKSQTTPNDQNEDTFNQTNKPSSSLSEPSQGLPSSSSKHPKMFSTSSISEVYQTEQSSSDSSNNKTERGSSTPPTVVSFADSLFASPTPSSTPTRQSAATGLPLPNRAITRKNTNPAERFNHLHPLLNLVVAERAYLTDYGVWGRDSYLRNFWKCVDWPKVEQSFSKFAPKPSLQSHYSIWKT